MNSVKKVNRVLQIVSIGTEINPKISLNHHSVIDVPMFWTLRTVLPQSPQESYNRKAVEKEAKIYTSILDLEMVECG